MKPIIIASGQRPNRIGVGLRSTLSIGLLLTLLSACGQKGPLRPPDSSKGPAESSGQASNTPAPPAAAASSPGSTPKPNSSTSGSTSASPRLP